MNPVCQMSDDSPSLVDPPRVHQPQHPDATTGNPAWLGEEPERVQRVMPA